MLERECKLEAQGHPQLQAKKEKAIHGWQVCDICSPEVCAQGAPNAFQLGHQRKMKRAKKFHKSYRMRTDLGYQDDKDLFFAFSSEVKEERIPDHCCTNSGRSYCSEKLLYHGECRCRMKKDKAEFSHRAFTQKPSPGEDLGQIRM